MLALLFRGAHDDGVGAKENGQESGGDAQVQTRHLLGHAVDIVGIAAETAKYNVVLGGTLNLKTEAIDVAVTPVVKGGRGVVTSSIASVVRVGGTLSAPALAVDPVGVAKTAVGAGVAVLATPWWLADTLLKKIQTDPTPCATALGK